jgi:DNA-binding response OmpR family regulator
MLGLVKLSFDKCVQIGRPFSASHALPAHEFFQASGFFRMAECDGPQVLSLTNSRSLAPVLFDIRLPTGDGFEILRFVRQKCRIHLLS